MADTVESISAANTYEQAKDTAMHIWDSIPSLSDIVSYVWKWTPNTSEVMYGVLPVAAVSVMASDIVSKFGDNPVNRGVVRDITKISGVALNIYSNNELGSSGRVYDSSNLYASTFKITCKVAVISTAVSMSGPIYGYIVGPEIANKICDPLSKMITLAGEDRQDEGKLDEYLPIYAINNWKTSWLIGGGLAGVVKVAVVTKIGSVIAHVGISKVASKISVDGLALPGGHSLHGIKHLALLLAPGINLNTGTVFEKVATILEKSDSMYGVKAIKGLAAAVIHDFVAETVKGIFDTMMLTPPARVVSDLTKKLVKYVLNESDAVTIYSPNESLSSKHDDKAEFDFGDIKHDSSLKVDISYEDYDDSDGMCIPKNLIELDGWYN